MSGYLAIDFGTSNSIIAVWNDNDQQAHSLSIPEYSKIYQQEGKEISVIPSLIHYSKTGEIWIGNQVLEKGLNCFPETFRWFKRYIQQRIPIKVNIAGSEVSPSIAGRDFLKSVLVNAIQHYELEYKEIAVSVPVESYEHYDYWLSSVIEECGFSRYRLVDEPTAAAIGYGSHLNPGDTFAVFDFGGGTIHFSIILVEEQDPPSKNLRCRVIGKSGKDIGGSTIDTWIFQKFLKENHLHDWDKETRLISNQLLVECEKAKEKLSFTESAEIRINYPQLGDSNSYQITRSVLDELFDEHDLYTIINHLVRTALNTAREYGFEEEDLRTVLMIGGSSHIPLIQKAIRQIFGKERVKSHRPYDAVAIGAAAFIAGKNFLDYIQHRYAIRYWNPQKGLHGDYDYRTIIEKGTIYPSSQPISRLTIKASNPNQKKLGIAIFEMGSENKMTTNTIELVFDPQGCPRIMPVSPGDHEQRSMFWMNENNLTFIEANPPANPEENRFEVEFSIDHNKRLMITVRDNQTGKLTHENFPVVQLT